MCDVAGESSPVAGWVIAERYPDRDAMRVTVYHHRHGGNCDVITGELASLVVEDVECCVAMTARAALADHLTLPVANVHISTVTYV